jgi:tetratricopeptide (TPR) repeat protein
MSTDDDKLAKLNNLLNGSEPCAAEGLELASSLARSLDDEDERAWQTVKVARKLASIEEWDKAETLARSIDNACPYEKTVALRAVAWQLIKGERREQAIRLLNEAAALARSVNPRWQQAELLSLIAKTLARVGESERSFLLWGEATKVALEDEASPSSQDRIDAASVLWEIAESIALVGSSEMATEVAKSIRTEGKRRHALEGVERIKRGGPPSQFYDPESS